MGHISRQGQAHARAMLVEAGHIAVRSPEAGDLLFTGDGLKTLDAVAPTVTVPAMIKPTIEAFRGAGFEAAPLS